MRKILYIIPSLLVSLVSQAQISFQTTYGNQGYEHGRSAVETQDTCFVLVGSTSSWGSGNTDVYMVKIDRNGNYLWSKTFGGNQVDWGYDVIENSSGELLIAGYTNSFGNGAYDMYLIKTDANGNLLWEKTYGGNNWDFAYSISNTPDDNVLLAGETHSYGAGMNDGYLVKVNQDGDTLWTKTYGAGGEESITDVVVSATGEAYLAGYSTSFGLGLEDYCLIKTDQNGDTLWTRTTGSASDDRLTGITELANGDIFTIGTTQGTAIVLGTDLYMIRYDASGNYVWSSNYGINVGNNTFSVIENDQHNIIINGTTEHDAFLKSDYLFIEYDSHNNWLSSKTIGNVKRDDCYNSIHTYDDGVLMIGTSESYGYGHSSMYCVKIDSLNTSSSTSSVTSHLDITSLDEYRMAEANVYPNPTQQHFFVETNFPVTPVIIYDLSMKEVAYLTPSTSNKNQYNVEGIKNGVYIAVISHGNFTFAKKLIIQR